MDVGSILGFAIDSRGAMKTIADFRNNTERLALLFYVKMEIERLQAEIRSEIPGVSLPLGS